MAYEIVAERTFKIVTCKTQTLSNPKPAFDPTTDKDIVELTDQAMKGECFLPTRRTKLTIEGENFIKEELLYAPIRMKIIYDEMGDFYDSVGSFHDAY